MDYYEYGTALKVPGIDPRIVELDGVHVWHVFEDSDTLHKVMSKDIGSFGQLKALVELSSIKAIGIGEDDYERAVASALAIDLAMKYWRVGRGKHVNREVLLASGQVSGNYINEVSALVNELDGDGLALIKELKAGKVSRFWSSKRRQLRSFFEDNGYIDHRDRYSREEILLQVMDTMQVKVQSGLITSTRVSELVDRVVSAEGSVLSNRL
jgi:hypothetical protein